jgi:hypothetical protein
MDTHWVWLLHRFRYSVRGWYSPAPIHAETIDGQEVS